MDGRTPFSTYGYKRYEVDAIMPVDSTPQEFARVIADDIVRTRKIASDNKITFEE